MLAATVVAVVIPQKPDDNYCDDNPPAVAAAEQTAVVAAGVAVVIAAISQRESPLSEIHIDILRKDSAATIVAFTATVVQEEQKEKDNEPENSAVFTAVTAVTAASVTK